MYIKLTRLDNTPIWINASFVVTIEPRKGGGSVVVPIGDGLDYDVKEMPESVLSLLDGAPAPAVVPVPPPPMLAPTQPSDVSPETPEPTPPPAAELAAHPARRTTRSRAKAKPAAETASAGGAADDKPAAAKKTRTPRKAKRSTQDFALPPEPEPAQEPEPAPESAPTLDLAEEQVARLKKMAPGSVRKLQNTLVTQFRVSDPGATIAALVAQEALVIERDHVIWK